VEDIHEPSDHVETPKSPSADIENASAPPESASTEIRTTSTHPEGYTATAHQTASELPSGTHRRTSNTKKSPERPSKCCQAPASKPLEHDTNVRREESFRRTSPQDFKTYQSSVERVSEQRDHRQAPKDPLMKLLPTSAPQRTPQSRAESMRSSEELLRETTRESVRIKTTLELRRAQV
jgi:hypothetical protein